LLNAGIFYAQGARRGSGLAWVLGEVARRIDLFMHHPEAVRQYVPWAVAPYFSNSDEQTLMNDVVVSAMTNLSYYVFSTALHEYRYGGRKKKPFTWEQTAEYALKQRARKEWTAMGQDGPLGRCEGWPALGKCLYPLRPLGASSAAGVSWLVRAPVELFSHYTERYLDTSGRSIGDVVDSAEERVVAFAEGRPASYATHRRMPAVMAHLASVRAGAWARRAVLRARGWWHPEADGLAAETLGWGRRRRGLLRLAGSSSGLGACDPPSSIELDTLVGNLLLLGALGGLVVVIPETLCGFEPRGRGFGLGGFGADLLRTAPRRLSGGLEQRCAWGGPKPCWMVEYITELEWERQGRPAAMSAAEVALEPRVAAVLRGGGLSTLALSLREMTGALMGRPLLPPPPLQATRSDPERWADQIASLGVTAGVDMLGRGAATFARKAKSGLSPDGAPDRACIAYLFAQAHARSTNGTR